MSRKAITCWGLVGCIVLANVLRTKSQANETTQPPANEVEDFGDGIVSLRIERTTGIEGHRNTAWIRNARLVRIGERYFVRGAGFTPSDQEHDWYDDIDVAVAWENVVGFYVFTEEQMKNYMAAHEDE